jgi:PHD/YefM family antitoxin component YafN of YafNO toxin-antitoxin module|tara:strand:- start:216 stop:434 length:219 start_codon:yes stop_codon:yes gene_type:complete
MAKVRVEGHTGLVRDTNSNAIVNVSKSDYQLYMSRYTAREKQSDVLRDTVKEINTLKQELFEIKRLIKEIKN